MKGNVTTDKNISNVLKTIEHKHLPSKAQVDVSKAMSNMKIKVQNNFDNPSRLFVEETSTLSRKSMVLTNENSVKISLRRIRNKKYPSLCPLTKLKISGVWA